MSTGYIKSPIGVLEVICQGSLVSSINFVEKVGEYINPDEPTLKLCLSELERYFKGELKSFSVGVKIESSEFSREVYRQLLGIKFGEVISYKELAKRAGRDRAFRAVGSANGKNKIPIIIPCHRVIGANGLGGYSGGEGLKTKLWLLAHEGVDVSKFKI
ncbi:methylated-DNA--[protein]-cysteine S-methyltransferase [Campylobacter sp. 19-13652]|uniref:methylated-DNA--[protein]-cysteine S-methyltransferase n=1 Tax=Campylobacter sp. 19-13652 TaxID=2840180 RepID=UPI001C745CA2|nr:methylated-DNA--[protein]-cysteine S-methyltransferase [Campylobacter sp. 19-13652]BCX79377.1 methylated-DNA--protein-cysteine methyltransferase [Campylobacter sp. 19-13652]